MTSCPAFAATPHAAGNGSAPWISAKGSTATDHLQDDKIKGVCLQNIIQAKSR
jgi:hypothetical protein